MAADSITKFPCFPSIGYKCGAIMELERWRLLNTSFFPQFFFIFCIFVFAFVFSFLYLLIRILRICHNGIGDSIMLVSSHIVGAPKPIGTSGEGRGISNRQTTPTNQHICCKYTQIHTCVAEYQTGKPLQQTNQHICCKYTHVHMCSWQTYKYKDDTKVELD